MKVKAIATGFYGFLRQPGDEFDVPEGETATWLEPIRAAAERKKPKASAETSDDAGAELT